VAVSPAVAVRDVRREVIHDLHGERGDLLADLLADLFLHELARVVPEHGRALGRDLVDDLVGDLIDHRLHLLGEGVAFERGEERFGVRAHFGLGAR